MKNLFSALVAVLFGTVLFVYGGNTAYAQATGDLSTTPPTPIRTTAVLTTSDVLSTTFSIQSFPNVVAVHYYINFTKGSLTSATFTPAGEPGATNAAATGYYKSPGNAITVNADGRYHIRVPVTDVGAPRYHGILTKGEGTATSSDALIYYKLETR